MEDKVLFSKDKTTLCLYFSKEKKDKYKIPNTIQRIRHYEFYGSCLKSIMIPRSVLILNRGIFDNCQSLISIEFENDIGLERIPQDAFRNCNSLKKISKYQDLLK